MSTLENRAQFVLGYVVQPKHLARRLSGANRRKYLVHAPSHSPHDHQRMLSTNDVGKCLESRQQPAEIFSRLKRSNSKEESGSDPVTGQRRSSCLGKYTFKPLILHSIVN